MMPWNLLIVCTLYFQPFLSNCASNITQIFSFNKSASYKPFKYWPIPCRHCLLMKDWRSRSSSLAMDFTCKKKKPNVKVSNDSSKWKWKMVKGMKPMHFSIVLLSYFLLSNNGWSANVELMLLDSNVISHNNYIIFVKSHNLLNCNLLFYAWEKEWS